MAEFITPVIDCVFKCFVDSTAPHIGYIWNCMSKFENLKEQLEKLQQRRNLMQSRIEQAKNNGDDIEEEVTKWLDQVNDEIVKVEQVINEYEGAETKCLKSLCPNVKKRYQHGKKAVNKANDVLKLLMEENFDLISYPSKLQGTWLSNAFYQEFESRTSILDDVMDALSRSDVTMVGIHGMGGVGKSTLARKVCEKANQNKQFEYVVFAEVSQKPDDKKIHEIQGLIAGSLRLKLENDDPLAVRAARLIQSLKEEKKVLILDDVWEKLEWNKIGIPFNNEHKSCKVLLTARDRNVLERMDCRNNFAVATLNGEESWELFKKIAGSCVEDFSLETLASAVAKRCCGLPVAIVSTAQALKGKPVHVWEHALDQLDETTFSCFQFSYDQLRSKALKSLFLLCCSMTLIREVSLDNLLRYSWSLDLFKRCKTMEGQRSCLLTLIDELKGSSLLLQPPGNGIFSIHDLVLDFGNEIAEKQNYLFVNETLHPSQRGHLENLTTIFLVDMSELPKRLICPNAIFLYLKTKNKISVPLGYFEDMSKLKAVHLEGLDLSVLPTSLISLEELGVLYLKSCSLGDISIIGNIENLEILSHLQLSI